MRSQNGVFSLDSTDGTALRYYGTTVPTVLQTRAYTALGARIIIAYSAGFGPLLFTRDVERIRDVEDVEYTFSPVDS